MRIFSKPYTKIGVLCEIVVSYLLIILLFTSVFAGGIIIWNRDYPFLGGFLTFGSPVLAILIFWKKGINFLGYVNVDYLKIPELISIIHSRKRFIWIYALYTIGIKKVRSESVSQLLSEYLWLNRIKVRILVVWTIGRIKDKSKITNLLHLLEEEKNKRVIKWAIWSLGQIGNEEVIKELMDIKFRHNSLIVEKEIIRSIENLTKNI